MMHRRGVILIVLNLCALIALVFAWPQLMVAPGPLIPAHAQITGNCFACHAPFLGASANRCIACHKLADIGVRSTTGVLLDPGKRRIAFHQSLAQPDCMSCHSDHTGPALAKPVQQRFAHDLLRSDVRGQCAGCHRAPVGAFHAKAGSHCAQCHTQKDWKSASFDHARLFALTGPHNVACITCHVVGDTSRNTCFGCHRHQPDTIRASHARRGIANTDHCVRCHRGGAGECDEREGHGRGDD